MDVAISIEDNVDVERVESSAVQENIFWDFSTALYIRKDVKDACECLRRKYQLNINIVMFCCWAAQKQYDIFSVDDMSFIANHINTWNHGIVEGLKKVYAKLACHSIGDETANLANGTLNDILLAEKIEQWLILQAVDQLGARQSITQDPTEIALKNIFNYINSQQVALHKTDLEKVYRIVKECFA
ncbi:MAG TPA: DUF2390 domain-containing protein [Gammaproteobacteria bacterium]|nr:DUF2390 domain-containing protein [Gammaproteobacteria bacterium]